MALANSIKPEIACGVLATWLGTRLPGAANIRVFDAEVPIASGLSTETVMFTYAWRDHSGNHEQRAVARVAPAGPGLFMTYDLAKEARVMSALAEQTGLPVPKILFTEPDAAVLGAPFFVMERIAGRVPGDDPPFTTQGWFMDLPPADRGRICHASLDAMAALHAVDLRAVGLDDLGPSDPDAALDTMIAEWRTFFDWAREGQSHPVIEPAFDWLAKNRPSELGPVGLSWGDARPGNMLFGEKLDVAAILDWEMVSVGPREQDLAWWAYMARHHTDAMNISIPEGMPSADEAIAYYANATGHTPKNLEFFQVLAGVRLSTLVLRAAHLMIVAGFLPENAPMGIVNPATRILAELIGVPVPTGDADYYAGNR